MPKAVFELTEDEVAEVINQHLRSEFNIPSHFDLQLNWLGHGVTATVEGKKPLKPFED